MKIDYNLLGRRIARLRKERRLTQDKLSEKAEISNNYLSNIENGRSIPSLETLVRLCEAMEVTPDTVLMGTVTDVKQYMNDDIQQLLAQCTPQEKRYVIGILKVFLAERSRP